MAAIKKYALVHWNDEASKCNWLLTGYLNKEETRLYHTSPSSKGLYISIGQDVVIKQRFATKEEMKSFNVKEYRKEIGIPFAQSKW